MKSYLGSLGPERRLIKIQKVIDILQYLPSLRSITTAHVGSDVSQRFESGKLLGLLTFDQHTSEKHIHT